MTDKQTYQALCDSHPEIPLFLQYWWLEGVCAGKDWDVIIVRKDPADENSEIIAALPFEIGKWLWKRYVRPSEMTPYGGWWISPDVRSDSAAVMEIGKRIAEQLKARKLTAFHQRFFPEDSLVTALADNGFKFTNRRTYMLDDVRNLESVVTGFSRNKRKKLEKWSLIYEVKDVDPEVFYHFHSATCRQKNRRVWYTREMLLVITEKTLQRGQCRLVGVSNPEGELLAAALLVWDNTTVYMLVNTFDHDQPSGGAREVLAFEAVKQARSLGLSLDFVCSRDYLKNYGAKRHVITSVHYGSNPFVTMQRFIDWLKR